MAQIIQMPQRMRNIGRNGPNRSDRIPALSAVKRAVVEMTASVDDIAGFVEQLQKCLDIVALLLDSPGAPAERLLLRERCQRLRARLSAANKQLQSEAKMLRQLDFEMRLRMLLVGHRNCTYPKDAHFDIDAFPTRFISD
jgi:hypothetical protein